MSTMLKMESDPWSPWIFKWIKNIVIYLCGVLALILLTFIWVLSQIKLMFIKLGLGLFTGESFEILSGMDAMANCLGLPAFTDANCQVILYASAIFKGKLDMAKFMQRTKYVVDTRDSRTGRVKYPKFKQKAVRKYGYYVWVDEENFTMDNKVRVYPETYTDTASLMKLFQKVHTEPFSQDRSPWELIVFNKASKENEEDEFDLLYRVHHTLADGVNLLLVTSELLDKAPSSLITDFTKNAPINQLPPIYQCNPFFRYLANPSAKMTLSGAIDIALNIFKILFAAPMCAMAPVLFKKETNAMNLPVTILSGRKLMALSNRLDLDVFKYISSVYECSINDVFMYCLTGAYERHNAAAPIETDANIRVFMPIFLLPPNTSWSQNGLTYGVVHLPIRNENPAIRLREIAKISRDEKSSATPICNFLIIQIFANHLPLCLARYIFISQIKFSVMSSNVCGPTTEHFFLENPMTQLFFLPINANNNAVSFGLLTYNGCAQVAVTVDRAVAPDDNIAQQLVDDFIDELKGLQELAKGTKVC